MLACWIRGNKNLTIAAPASHVRSVRYMSEVRVYRRPTQVQRMGGEFIDTALYCAGVVSVRLCENPEKKLSRQFCVRFQCVFDSQSTSGFIRRLELVLIIFFMFINCVCSNVTYNLCFI